MKRLVAIILFSIAFHHANAQFEKVILKYGRDQTRWLIVCTSDTAETCELLTFFPNGKLMGRAKVVYHDSRNRFRPNGDAIIYFPNGKIFQNYNHEAGTLLTYYPTGELEEKMISPINGTIERKYKYYKNGTLWEEEEAKHEPGRQSFQYSYSNSSRVDKIYDNQGISYNYFKTFHGNGNLKSFNFIDRDATHFQYIQQYFTPDGMLDTLASNGQKLRNKLVKNSYRYYYHSNGQLQEIAYFENDKLEGEQLRWTANGQLVWRANYSGGYRRGLFETWWEDDSKKEISYIQGYEKHGPSLRWHRDGRIVEQGTYYRGKSIGVATVWDTLGGVWSQNFGGIEEVYNNYYYNPRYLDDRTVWIKAKGNFVNGMRDGYWMFYFQEQGKSRQPIDGICATLNYKDGLLHGNVRVFHPNGQLLLNANLKDGWLDGDYVSYRDNGFIIAKGQFKNHKKEGVWTYYHYKSDRVNRIVYYENDIQKYVIREYDTDGFVKKKWIDNKALQQYELYDYYKSEDSLYIEHTQPYGWTNMNYYEYRYGTLVKSREITFDNPEVVKQTEYYTNGQRKSLATYIKNKTDGTYWQWYENGQLKLEAYYETGKREGITYEWSEDGTVKETAFTNGVQVIPNTKDEIALECSCNKAPKEVESRYMSSFWNYVDFEKVKARISNFVVDESARRLLYAKNIQMYNYVISGEIAVLRDLYVNVDNGLRLNFTPCRRGVNRTYLDIYGVYNKERDEAIFELDDFDLSVEFPQKILRLYDVEAQRPLQTSIVKYRNSSVRFSVDRFRYEEGRGEPSMTMKTNGNSCFQISEIGTTGFLLNGYSPELDLSTSSTVDLPWNSRQQPTEYGYLSFDVGYQFLVPSTRYLNDFIGVYFPSGKVYIPYNDGQLTALASHVWVSGTEIYGNIELSTDSNLSFEELINIPDLMTSKGFKILDKQVEDGEVLRVFWKYIAKE